ncbi:MAG: hypothetical protein ACRD6U_02070 [Nitrososphaeraceae archaeon]
MQSLVIKSPLSIIALFVALIEAFLAYPVTQLEGIERLILVTFMTSFPFFVAIGFFYILWHKPINLYNPGEIPTGLQDRYQPEIKAIAFEVKINEIEQQINTLFQVSNRGTSVFENKSQDGATIGTFGKHTTQDDLNSIEAELKSKIQKTTDPNPKTLRNIKNEIQNDRMTEKREIIETIVKETSKFKIWLEKIGFKNLPEIPNIVLMPKDWYNIAYDNYSNVINVGGLLSDEYDGIFHTYFMFYLGKRWTEYEGEQAAILLGLSDYYACSFYNDPKMGEKLAIIAGMQLEYLRNLKVVVNLKDIEKEVHKMSVVWSGVCWELREKYGREKIDFAICKSIEILPKKLTMDNSSNILLDELTRLKIIDSKEEIITVFTKRGIQV